MKILHILRSEPDDMVALFIRETSRGNDASCFQLYQAPLDYDRLVQSIFESDRVFSWW